MAKARPVPSVWYKSWLFKTILLLALVAAFLGGIIWAGRLGLEHLRGSDRYDIAFADIECEPPASVPRDEFLQQARYYARLPEQLNLLDEALPAKLTDGFARHPWVESVAGVEIVAPRQICVRLTYRTPVLAVKTRGAVRAVDGAGILLPADAPTLGLPIYGGDASAPAGDGKRWGDPNVEAAARKLKR